MIEEALAYHRRFKPQALIVSIDGKIEHESYDGEFAQGLVHALYSGTKSFWGLTALLAQREGLLSLDDRVSDSVDAWKREAWKKRVTLRQLLQLVAGVPFGGLGASVPDYEKALHTELRNEPGTTFTYGGIPLQIFGAVFADRLNTLHLTPHEYLRDRLLEPNGIEIAKWRALRDGTNPLPTGAFMTARNWLAYGLHVLRTRENFAECFVGSTANPRYGLCWWLSLPNTPSDLFYASGSGGQALYVVPSLRLVAARFANAGSFNHAAFIKRLTQDL